MIPNRRRMNRHPTALLCGVLVLLWAAPSVCVAQESVSIQCPQCGAWNNFASYRSLSGSCRSCGYSFSGGGGGGGGNSSGDDSERPNPYAALEAAMEQINELERQLEPLRKQKQAKHETLAKLESELANLRTQLADAQKAAADAKARQQREQQIIAALEATLNKSRQGYDERLLATQMALAKAEALRQGRPVASVRLSTAADAPPVYLNEDALYKSIDPSTFITADIYAQAVRERNRQAALQKDVAARLAQVELLSRQQGWDSAKYVAMQRKEIAGMLGDVVDLIAPIPEVLKGKISAKALLKYRQAYTGLRTALAARATMNDDEFDAAMQDALTAFTEGVVYTAASCTDPKTARWLETLVTAYDAGGKALLATNLKDRDQRMRLYIKAVAALDPWATSGLAAYSLGERAVKYRKLTAVMENLGDQRNTTELEKRRLRDEYETLQRNQQESQRIIALWEARARKAGGP